MLARAIHHGHKARIAPVASVASVLSALVVDEHHRDTPRVAIPRPEIHLVVRFGPMVTSERGFDVHVMGVRQTAHRKLIRSGQRVVMARLQLGAHQAVLGVPASALNGRIVELEDLWGHAATRRLCDRLAAARDTQAAAAVLESAIAERLARTHTLGRGRSDHTQLVLDSARMLAHANVNSVARELRVSERHLRRVFHESLGMSPKTFAKLTRFQRALDRARERGHASWANIAVACGYYDQAHLIAEFRMLCGVTPQVLLDELREHSSLM